jgi:hypothetical protein
VTPDEGSDRCDTSPQHTLVAALASLDCDDLSARIVSGMSANACLTCAWRSSYRGIATGVSGGAVDSVTARVAIVVDVSVGGISDA